MPRHDNSSSYIAHGFVDDCDALMEKCAQFGRLNYEKFCDVWKEMQFVKIYHCRKSSAETAELSEEVLFIAKHYMINKNNNTEESVAGLFLVYALQNLQPYSRFAALRITLEDVPILENFIKVVRQQKRCDVLFILGSVLIKGPVQYHAAERERGMELSYRKYVEGTTDVKELNSRRRGVFSRHSEAMDLIKECQTITRLYSETKSDITGPKNADRNLSYVNSDLASELEASFKKLITGTLHEGKKNEDDNDNDQPEAVSSIKQRAMRNTVEPMKHLTGVRERKEIANKSPDKKKASKTNANSPTKSSKKTSPTKRKAPAKRKPKRKRIKKSNIKCESDSDDDDDNISLSSTDVDTDSSQKEKEPRMEQQYEIEIESLPVLFTTETEGKVYEIEVIDELKTDKDANNVTTDVKETTDAVATDDANYKVGKANLPEKVKRLERRELKQAILKSKFKRMGVLPVTNYKN